MIVMKFNSYCVRFLKDKVLDMCFHQISERNDCNDKSYCDRFVKYKVLDLCFLQISEHISCSVVVVEFPIRQNKEKSMYVPNKLRT